MRQSGGTIHISGQEHNKQERFVSLLRDMLQDRGHVLSELSEVQIREGLAISDEDLLAKTINWANDLLTQVGAVVLISTGSSLSRRLGMLSNYTPDLEVTIEEVPMRSASQYLNITAREANLPQEVAQVILRLETVLRIDQETSTEEYPTDDVYSAEEEQLLQEHLRSLGYL